MQPNQFSLANQYNLSGKNLHITYLPHGTATDHQPKFTYQDLHQTLSFSGEQIRSIKVEIGVLVSVTIRMTPDTGGTTFSLLIPRANVPGETSVPIETIGITTSTSSHRTSEWTARLLYIDPLAWHGFKPGPNPKLAYLLIRNMLFD